MPSWWGTTYRCLQDGRVLPAPLGEDRVRRVGQAEHRAHGRSEERPTTPHEGQRLFGDEDTVLEALDTGSHSAVAALRAVGVAEYAGLAAACSIDHRAELCLVVDQLQGVLLRDAGAWVGPGLDHVDVSVQVHPGEVRQRLGRPHPAGKAGQGCEVRVGQHRVPQLGGHEHPRGPHAWHAAGGPLCQWPERHVLVEVRCPAPDGRGPGVEHTGRVRKRVDMDVHVDQAREDPATASVYRPSRP